MILRLTPTTAALVGETPAEWQLLEKQVQAGRWTTGAREGRLRALAAELEVAAAGGRHGADATTAEPATPARL